MKTDITSTELRDLVYRLKYPPSKGAYQVKIDDVMKAIEAYVAQKVIEARLAGALDELIVLTDAGAHEPKLEIIKKRFAIKKSKLEQLTNNMGGEDE